MQRQINTQDAPDMKVKMFINLIKNVSSTFEYGNN